MSIPYRVFKFKYAYELTGFIHELVMEGAEEDYFTDHFKPEDQSFLTRISSPQKNTILHEIIRYYWNERNEYIRDKLGEDDLIKEYEKILATYEVGYPEMILTEDDLKCLLYHKFMEIQRLAEPKQTQDEPIIAHSIHTEVSWYDYNGQLTIKPDITILEPEHLSVLHRYGSNLRLPSKQFEFNGKSIIFELKFIRNKTGISRSHILYIAILLFLTKLI